MTTNTTTNRMTIGNNTPKEDIVGLLESVQNKTRIEKGLRDRIKYTTKKCREDMKNATRKDLLGLFDEIVKGTPELVTSGAVTPVEAQAKPKPVAKPNKPEAAKAAPAAPSKPAPAPAAKTPKAPAKPAKPEPKVRTSGAVNPKRADNIPVVTHFPETLENEHLGTLTLCVDRFTTYKEFIEYYDNDDAPTTLYIMVYWPKRLIKQFDYAGAARVPVPKEFKDDLDILEPYYICENVERVYAISRYTEANFTIDATDDAFAYVIDQDPRDKSDIKARYLFGMYFEIYETAK